MSFTISKVTQFSQDTLQIIPQNDTNEVVQQAYPLLGGILSEAKYIWHAKGPCLEVRNSKSGFKVGTWTFGCILRDSNTRIVCIEEIDTSNGHLPLLAVGLDCTISGGMICIFDAGSSRVIRAIHVKERISSMHVVDSALEVLNLPGSLRCFDGILAIGTLGGDVLLIDICRQICTDQEQVRDEVCPCQILIIPPHKITKVEQYKEHCIKDGNHLAIHLNIVLDSKTEHFTLKGPLNENKLFVNKEEVSVSKLYYCSQLTSLLVGFNFGAFQLWDLTTLTLVYTSPVCEDHLPITQFALLEPTDDPRTFCYVWVSYSNIEVYQRGLPFAVMYSFCYGSKEHHEGYGYLYQDFQFCTVRFQIELGALSANNKAKGGCCLNFQPVYKQQNNKEYFTKSTSDMLALTKISWTVWFDRGETQTNMLLFDLNQWYKEQMPSFSSWRESSNYILKTSITELVLMSGHKSSPLLDVRIITKSLNQFLGVQKLEEHFFPTALSFDVYVLRENDVMLVHNDSLQKALLSQIESAGPLSLVRPNDIYQQIIHHGLTPLFVDLQVNSSTSIEFQREVVLNVGLEHHLTGWLCKCASEWANGSFSSAGCSLDFLLNWAFYRAVTLKTTCDTYCKSLFDYSQLPLDSNTSILLNSCTRQINNLCTFYAFVLGKLHNYLAYPDIVEEQASSLDMVSIYFEVLVWMVNVGLLPECHQSVYPKVGNMEKINAPYPITELTKYYDERRAQLRLLSRDTFASSDQLLFIDNLISIKCGAEQLQKQWQDDGGSGLYPPPSLQSLLRSYLASEANLLYKHTLVIYVFLDLAMTLDQTKYSGIITHLIKFPAVFKVPPSLIKITQAFWQLDHGDFPSAMELMLDPQISLNDLQPWQHNIAMRALLLQEQNNLALFYMQVRKPPINNEKDILTAISLFVANNMLDEAFYFKNQHNSANIQMLLQHLYRECNKNGSLRNILYKRLNSEEEKAFFDYLKSINNPNYEDLQVFYYLLRARFIEAFDVHTNIKKRNPDSLGLTGQKNASLSDHVVRIFKKYLPDVSKNLVDYVRKERAAVWTNLVRPTPLSVFVHDNNEQVQYKSTVIHAALSKAKSTFLDDTFNLTTEETPFLRTPTALRRKNRLATTIVTPHVIDSEEECPSPAKRLKLSPRGTKVSPMPNQSMHLKMLTPIVKRNTSIDQPHRLDATPHSILKVKSQDDALSQTFDDVTRSHDSKIISVNSRTPVHNTPKNIHVQFDDTTRFSNSLDDVSLRKPLADSTVSEPVICIEDKLIQEVEQKRISLFSSTDVSMMVSSNESSGSDSYYSPSSSLEEVAKKNRATVIKEHGVDVIEHDNNTMENKQSVKEQPRPVPIEAGDETKLLPQSPRARRSYKRSCTESVSLEPRRTRSSSADKSHIESPLLKSGIAIACPEETPLKINPVAEFPARSISNDTASEPSSDPTSPQQSPRLLQKVNRRKPLSRQVLEQNAFSALQSSDIVSKEVTISRKESTVITETSIDTNKIITIESDTEVTDITSESRRSHRLEDSKSEEERIERVDEDFEKDNSFLSQLADEWLEFREASKNRGKDKPEEVQHVFVLDDIDTDRNKLTTAKQMTALDKDCTVQVELNEVEQNSRFSSEQECSKVVAQESKTTELIEELEEFIVPKTTEEHNPMEIDEDSPAFLSMVATEAVKYIIGKRKENESRIKADINNQDIVGKNEVRSEIAVQSVEAPFVETVESRPVNDNTCYTVSELDKAFLKSEVYTDLTKNIHVQFDDTTRFSNSLDDLSSRKPLADSTVSEPVICIEDKLIQEVEQKRISLFSSTDVSMMVSSNESSGSDNYYSPGSSLEEVAKKNRATVIKEHGVDVIEHDNNTMENKQSVKEQPRPVPIEADDETKLLPQSPRARRSYKRSCTEPVSLEPRRTRSASADKSHIESPLLKSGIAIACPEETPLKINSVAEFPARSISNDTTSEPSSTSDPTSPQQSPRLLQKVNRRKPLSRQVLEQNALSALQSSNIVSKEVTITRKEPTVITETSIDANKIITIESDTEVTDITSESRRSHRLEDSKSEEERIERVDEDFEKDNPFLSRLADEWLEFREASKNRGKYKPEEVQHVFVLDEIDTDRNKLTTAKQMTALDKDCTVQVELNEVEQNSRFSSEQECSKVVAQESKTTQLIEELEEFIVPKTTEEHNPMEIDEDSPAFLSMVATEAVKYIIEKRKENESRIKADKNNQDIVGKNEVRSEIAVQSVEAPFVETVESRPVNDNTCYTVSELDKAFLKSEVYTDLTSSSGNGGDSCDKLEVVFETNIGSAVKNDPGELSLKSTETGDNKRIETALKQTFVDAKESEVYQDLSSDSEDINDALNESRTDEGAFDELEDSVFESRPGCVPPREVSAAKRTAYPDNDVISISDEHEGNSSRITSSFESNSNQYCENGDATVDVMELGPARERSLHTEKTVANDESRLSQNSEGKRMATESKRIAESEINEDSIIPKDEAFDKASELTGESEISANVKYQSTELSNTKDINHERTPTPSKEDKIKGRFDEHTSSSDTTDGDAVKELVVTAVVHSPSLKKKTEEPLLKRVTRRNSALFAQQNVDPKHLPSSSKPSEEEQKEKKPASRKARSISLTSEHSGPSRRSLRSNSVETPDSGSVTKGKRRTMSIDELPVIAENVELEKKKSTMDRYTSTRRLTRKQAIMMKNTTIPEREEIEKLEDGEPFDPIDLLDKEPFQGKPDSEEEKVYQTSSPTASTVSSFRPGKRVTRSASAVSDTSMAQSSQTSTPKKQRSSKSQAKSPAQSKAGVKTRLRKQSDSNSVASEQSGSSTPSKRTRKKEDTEGQTSIKKTTKYRASSVPPIKSDSHTKRK